MNYNYTNSHNLPGVLARALKANEHRQEGKYSVSQLMEPPQIVQLENRNAKPVNGVYKVKKDVSSNLWSLLGTAIHKIIEQYAGPDDLIEEHMVVEIKLPTGKVVTLSGTPDHFGMKSFELNDWKCTAVYNYMRGGREDWMPKLNIYRWMIHKKFGKLAKRLTNRLILRDWQAREAKYKAGYPKVPFQSIDQDLMTLEDTEKLIIKRIMLHEAAQTLPIDKLPECTKEDRWGTDEKWAVVSSKTKHAIKYGIQENKAAAKAKLAENPKGREIQHRPSTYARCVGYCDVMPLCPQMKREAEEAKKKEKANA